MHKRLSSAQAFERACHVMPGGVNSPVRAFKGVGGTPVFFKTGSGAWLTDIDGNRYLDFVGSWGPLLFGHAHPAIAEAIVDAANNGISFGAPTERETELAELIRDMMPSMRMVRLVNSGTEATMSAIRLARGFTGRDLIVKFDGCYHGHGDAFLIAAGSGAATLGVPDSPGVPATVARATLVACYNDKASVEELFTRHSGSIAAVIVEPVAGNMGVVPPATGFLEFLRRITREHGALLIFDEVMTGFRVGPGGAQALYGVTPDITTLGKIVGGGLPIGAYGGSEDIMSRIAPAGPVYQAGTLSGNPVAVAAGLAALRLIRSTPGLYAQLEKTASLLANGLVAACAKKGIPAVCNRFGSMLTLFFTTRDTVASSEVALQSDRHRYGRYFHAMLDAGVYLPPSQFEAWFVSAVHTVADISRTLESHASALDCLLKEEG
ncbi:MAG: glutamate-1-semialdehyde 2,1-aminomutase [Chitinispirillaceae bacterium]|nr:glutamate-1-semialdehyde 2,1-aminomutase [Chitinispirillaceae bacterium]